MKRALPALFTLLAMLLYGGLYWVELAYSVDNVTGLLMGQEVVWWRYAALALPVAMAAAGALALGPRSIAVLRLRNRPLGILFGLAGFLAASLGLTRLVFGAIEADAYAVVLGVLLVWNGVWLLLCAACFFLPQRPAPTTSALWGVLALLPYCMQTVYYIVIKPTGLHRMAPFVQLLAVFVVVIWLALLLRGFYVALPRRVAAQLYVMGLLVFLLCGCLLPVQSVYLALFGSIDTMDYLGNIALSVLGLAAGGTSLAMARASGERKEPPEAQGVLPEELDDKKLPPRQDRAVAAPRAGAPRKRATLFQKAKPAAVPQQETEPDGQQPKAPAADTPKEAAKPKAPPVLAGEVDYSKAAQQSSDLLAMLNTLEVGDNQRDG